MTSNNQTSAGSAHARVADTVALVLAGGNGSRLGELTRWQCKPAIPFGGTHRNIDFTLSNCVNSGIRRIAVLTQYKAQTLITHIAGGWSFLPRHLAEFVEVWPAQQRQRPSWYAGTADAVYQNLDLLLAQRSRYTLILAGDHIYKMDYRALLARHIESHADVTVACVPVPLEDCGAYGILGADEHLRVRSFIEKPQPASLGAGLLAPSGPRTVLASMGVYVFTTEYLAERLHRDAIASETGTNHDFGRDILPEAVRTDYVSAYPFTGADGRPGYWRDVGTLDAYWQAHMDLLAPEPPLEFDDPAWPILTVCEQLTPARLRDEPGRPAHVSNSLLAGAVLVRAASVTNTVLCPKVQVGPGAILDEAVVLPNARIGANCRLRRVIIDAGMEVPDGTCVGWSGTETLDVRPSGRITLLSRNTLPPPPDEIRSVA